MPAASKLSERPLPNRFCKSPTTTGDGPPISCGCPMLPLPRLLVAVSPRAVPANASCSALSWVLRISPAPLRVGCRVKRSPAAGSASRATSKPCPTPFESAKLRVYGPVPDTVTSIVSPSLMRRAVKLVPSKSRR
ncbi:hypothetical protein D3C76_869200 [compost metagenome]